MASTGLYINTISLCMAMCLIGLASIEKAWANNSSKVATTMATRCFDHICLKPGYSPDKPPPTKDDSPIQVDLDFQISPLSVYCNHNVVGLSIRLRQTWIDNRVYSDQNTDKRSWLPTRMGRDPSTGLPGEIWMPNLFFYSMTNMDIKTNFREQSLLWLFENDVGDKFLNYDTIFDLYVKCPMKYWRYPFDEHECSVRISSAAQNSSKIFFNMPKNVTINASIINPVGEFDSDVIQLNETEREDVWEGEKWSVAGFKIKLSRRYWGYVVNYYITSALFVYISWISFLVPGDDVNARIALLITMLLVLVTVSNGVIDNSPAARDGSTALGLWMFSMVLFIFIALGCHCIAIIIRRKKVVRYNNVKKYYSCPEIQLPNTDSSSTPVATRDENGHNFDTEDLKAQKSKKYYLIDSGIFTMLTILFLLYLMVYIFVYK